MKIAFLSVLNRDVAVGGVENHIDNVAEVLRNNGHQVTLYAPKFINNGIEAKSTKDMVIIPINKPSIYTFFERHGGGGILGYLFGFMRKFLFVFYARKIANWILNENNDLVHQHDFISNIFSTKIISKKIPCILTNHTGEYLFIRKFPVVGDFVLRWLLNHYEFVLGPSTELTPTVNIHIRGKLIWNGVNTKIFRPSDDKKKLRIEYGIPPDAFVVFCPRRWAPTKGVIYMMQSIRDGGYDKRFLFLFAGSDYKLFPKYSLKIKSIYNQILNKESVRLLGDLSSSQISDYMAVSDVVVIPSLYEAVSLAALEAMASGTPVLASSVGGNVELIQHGKNGILFRPRDAGAITEAIKRISVSPDSAQHLIRAGLETACENTWNNVGEELEQVYKSGLNKRSKR